MSSFWHASLLPYSKPLTLSYNNAVYYFFKAKNQRGSQILFFFFLSFSFSFFNPQLSSIPFSGISDARAQGGLIECALNIIIVSRRYRFPALKASHLKSFRINLLFLSKHVLLRKVVPEWAFIKNHLKDIYIYLYIFLMYHCDFHINTK